MPRVCVCEYIYRYTMGNDPGPRREVGVVPGSLPGRRRRGRAYCMLSDCDAYVI